MFFFWLLYAIKPVNEIDYFWFVSILCSFWFLLGCFLPVFPLKFHYLHVWVSACYCSSLPGSGRSLGTASAIGFGMKSLLLCFVFISLFSGVAVVWVWLDLVFGFSFLLIDLHFGTWVRTYVRGILNSQQQAKESLENHLDVFEALQVYLKC